jgi:hypothetical protein
MENFTGFLSVIEYLWHRFWELIEHYSVFINKKSHQMKSFSAILLALFLSLPMLSVAQKNEYDALYLNNGSILRGKVLESTPGKGVRIEIVGNNVLFIPENEIQKVVMREENTQPTDPTVEPSKIELFPQIHLFGGGDQSWGFTTAVAYKFPFRLSAGAGTGVEWFSGAMLPVFATVNYKILPGTLSPYLYGQAGYAFSIDNSQDNYYYYYGQNQKNHGGFMGGIGAGLRKDFSSSATIAFSIGYRFQQTKITSEYNPYYDGDPSHVMKTERTEKYNRIALSVGIIF